MPANEKVFGIGFSKTATTSLESALEILGFNVCRGDWRLKHNDYHLSLYIHRDYDELKRMTQYWDAFADGPWGGTDLYEQIYEWYPEACYIQTLRDPQSWYNSLIGMITSVSGDSDLRTALDSYHRQGRYGSAAFFRHIFGIQQLDGSRERILDYFETTNRNIAEFFREKNARFLQLDITAGDGWDKLCPFLDRPIPNRPFPKANTAAGKAAANQGLPHPTRHKRHFFQRIRSRFARMLRTGATGSDR